VNAFAVTAFVVAFVALMLAIVVRRNASVLLVAGILCAAGGWMSLVR
jgi:hypothetical protein